MVARERERKGRESASASSMRDRVRQRAESREQQGSWVIETPEGVNKFEPKVIKGGMHLDIVPYVIDIDNHPSGMKKGEMWYERTYFIHRDVGVDNKARICLLKTFKKSCPVCEHREGLTKQGKDKELTKALLPKERQLFNVIDRDDEDKGVQLWDISYHLFGKQLEKEVREGKEEYAGFAELHDGFTLNVRFEARTLPTKDGSKPTPFMDADRIDFEKREDYGKDILEETLNLDELLVELTYKQLEIEFLQLEDSDVENTSDDKMAEEPERKPSHFRRSAKSEEPLKKLFEEQKAPVRTRERTRVAVDTPKCPDGGEFGKDCDALSGCQECPESTWKACGELYEEMKKDK